MLVSNNIKFLTEDLFAHSRFDSTITCTCIVKVLYFFVGVEYNFLIICRYICTLYLNPEKN